MSGRLAQASSGSGTGSREGGGCSSDRTAGTDWRIATTAHSGRSLQNDVNMLHRRRITCYYKLTTMVTTSLVSLFKTIIR